MRWTAGPALRDTSVSTDMLTSASGGAFLEGGQVCSGNQIAGRKTNAGG